MALFGIGKDKKKSGTPTAAAAIKKDASKKSGKKAMTGVAGVLISPRITEKAANLTARHVYTFNVRTDATKRAIAEAIIAEYKVTPVKVGIVHTKGQRVRLRSRYGWGRTVATKKAYVYLKPEDRIEFAS